jgi:hypothetical protein
MAPRKSASKKSHRAKGHKISAAKKLDKVTPLSVTASALNMSNVLTTSPADPKLVPVNQQIPTTQPPTGGSPKWDIATNKPA